MNRNILKLEEWEVDEVIKLGYFIKDLRTQKCVNFRIQELNKDDFRKGIATSRPPISSLLPTEAAPADKESTLKSYFRFTLQPGSEMSNRTTEVKLDNEDKLDK